MRQLKFLFQEPGLLEAVAIDPNLPKPENGLDTPGYSSFWVADLMVDYDPRVDLPYAFMISSFEKSYPLVIWALKLYMAGEKFDLPQAQLKGVPLHEAFSWAYAHFILEDDVPKIESNHQSVLYPFSNQVLQYAAAV